MLQECSPFALLSHCHKKLTLTHNWGTDVSTSGSKVLFGPHPLLGVNSMNPMREVTARQHFLNWSKECQYVRERKSPNPQIPTTPSQGQSNTPQVKTIEIPQNREVATARQLQLDWSGWRSGGAQILPAVPDPRWSHHLSLTWREGGEHLNRQTLGFTTFWLCFADLLSWTMECRVKFGKINI